MSIILFNLYIYSLNFFVACARETTLIHLSRLDATKLVRDTFEPTPPMSTYLLAFVVSEYRLRENNAGTFAVLARPLAYSQTDYIYNVGQQTLDAMSAWLAYDYYAMPNISKMYLVALPDSNVAAMENWALLTFREATLLHEAGETSAWAQQRLVTMVVHEQAHMWFGNLVTVDWWSETWLNEGFAQFFQYFGTALVMADWQLEEQFVVQQMHVAMALDAQLHAKALRSDVTTPGEIAAKFDRISYNKGAAILRMLQHAMGTDAFQSAVRDYLVQRWVFRCILSMMAVTTTTPIHARYILQCPSNNERSVPSQRPEPSNGSVQSGGHPSICQKLDKGTGLSGVACAAPEARGDVRTGALLVGTQSRRLCTADRMGDSNQFGIIRQSRLPKNTPTFRHDRKEGGACVDRHRRHLEDLQCPTDG